jgi:hypothetical protein
LASLSFLKKEDEDELKDSSRKKLIEKLIGKMFDAALKEKFSQLTKKYDPDLVFEIWAKVMKCRRVKISFTQWKPNMTLRQALDSLDDRFNSIEASARKLQEKGEGKKKKSGRRTGGR